MYPAHLLSEHGTRVSDQFAFDEMQFDDTLRIRVLGGENLTPSMNRGIQFLADFPRETFVQGLSRVAFPAGKFPIAFEMYTALTPRDEKGVAAPDHRCRDEDARCVT